MGACSKLGVLSVLAGRHYSRVVLICALCRSSCSRVRIHASRVCTELEIRRQLGWIGFNTLLLTVEDPKPNIGSGSALLNALLCVAERLSAKKGLTVRYVHSVML